MVEDRTEGQDLAGANPATIRELAGAHPDWAERCGVIPRQPILDFYQYRHSGGPPPSRKD